MRAYTNFEVHLDVANPSRGGFHSKGYLFTNANKSWSIIGSTNLTLFALKKNVEWNVYNTDSNLNLEARTAFDILWQNTLELSQQLIKEYQDVLEIAIERWDMDYVVDDVKEKPNYMQQKALKELKRYRDMGVDKALIIAATGSGKTHLAAFDVSYFRPAKTLFIVHRETILKDAQSVFKRILPDYYSFGFLTGNKKDYSADIIFATNITLANHLDLFEAESFDYIVFDEVHHASASTYQKIWDHFTPQFRLGLTATPERRDDPDSIFHLFEHNVPLDLRLRDAIEYNLVVPFHYYGIRNQLIDYGTQEASQIIRDMAQEENVFFVKEELSKYLPQDKLKALVFCIDINHAKRMSELMSDVGFNTTYLIGHHNTTERMQTFKNLQEENHPLEMIFAVDILNEGVDIPKVNLVMFLRPTESPIIFLQQLGRGLRKVKGKSHLTVLDFIGNSYKRSVQVLRALGSLHPHEIIEKQTLIDLLRTDFEALDLPGVKINIDTLSKEEMIQSIESENFNLRKYLEADYKNFKHYIKSPSYPSHMDYLKHDVAPDLVRFINAKIGTKNSSYYTFLKRLGEPVPAITDSGLKVLNQISELLPLVRFEEFLILKLLMQKAAINMTDLIQESHDQFEMVREDHIDNALMHLESLGLIKNQKPDINRHFDLESPEFMDHVFDLIDYGLDRYQRDFENFSGDFKPYMVYTKKQVSMMSLQDKIYTYIKGTKIERDGTVYIYVNLTKDDSTAEHLKYNDYFYDAKTFI